MKLEKVKELNALFLRLNIKKGEKVEGWHAGSFATGLAGIFPGLEPYPTQVTGHTRTSLRQKIDSGRL